MVNRYWVAAGAQTTANTASNWNTQPDGGGSSGVPTTNDEVIFGHDTSFDNNLGTAPCAWDLALTLTRFQTLANYNAITIEDDTGVAFASTAKTITFSNNSPGDLGFKAGMVIAITGSTSNNGNHTIASVADDVITVSGSLTDETAGQSVTVTYDTYIDLTVNITVNRLDLDCHLKNTTLANKNITLSGTYPASNTYVFNDSNAQISNKDLITYVFDSSANTPTAMNFVNGPYPKVSLGGTNAYYTPQASTSESSADNQVTMYSLSIGGTSFFQHTASTASPINDSKKKFVIGTTGFSLSCDLFDMGLATLEFQLDGNFELPVTGSATYGDADNSFVANYRDLVITTTVAGRKATIPEDRTLSVNSLKIGPDAVLEGYATKGNHKTSTVISVSRPSILGAWNFSQMSDGVYVSLMEDAFPITPSDGPGGRVQLSNDGGTFTSDAGLTFASSTLHADQAIKLTEGADHPILPAAGTGIIWVKNTAPSTLVFTDDAGTDTTLGSGGGGGSGTVTSVAVTGSDGIEVDSGSPITTSGTIALGVNKTNMLSHLNVEDGADVTDTANVTAAGALMDSEVTNLADVKAFDPADYATAAQGTTADNALPKAGGTMTGEIEGTTITLNAIPADPATDAKVRLGESGTSSNMLRIQTNDGRIDIGPNNGSYAHIQTDRAQFYFQQPILVDGGGKVFAYNDGLKLGTGTTAAGGTTAITIANGSTDITVAGTATSTGFIKSGGTSSEFLMADGSVSTGGGGGSYSDAQAIAAVEGEATLALTGDVTIASGKGLTVDTNTLKVDATNNRVGIGQASPTTTLHVESSGTAIGLIKSSGGHANVRIDRATNQSDAALLFYTGGSLGWRIQESGSAGNPGNDLYIIDQDGSPDTARMRFHDAGTVEVSQAFQQGTVANAVLVADANGVLTAASALQDLAYLQGGQAELDAFTPTGISGPHWLGAPPNTIQEAIERIAAQVGNAIGPIP